MSDPVDDRVGERPLSEQKNLADLGTPSRKYTHASGECRRAQHAVPLQICGCLETKGQHAVPEVPPPRTPLAGQWSVSSLLLYGHSDTAAST